MKKKIDTLLWNYETDHETKQSVQNFYETENRTSNHEINHIEEMPGYINRRP